MKKILLPLAIGLLLTSVTYANKQDRMAKKEAREEKREIRKERRHERNLEVSYLTEEQFGIDFPDATNVSFEKSKWFDEVNFTLDGKNLKAYYDLEGKLVGTTSKKLFSDIPVSAQNEIRKQYKNYQVKEVIMFDDNEYSDTDMILYGSAFEDADNYFVRLQNGNKDIVLKVSMEGMVSYYTQIKKV